MIDSVRARVIISGRVQGVFFRASTLDAARTIGVSGWVRNLPDGRVEALFEGDRKKVDKIIAWCYEVPPPALVKNVDVLWEKYKGDQSSFKIIY